MSVGSIHNKKVEVGR